MAPEHRRRSRIPFAPVLVVLVLLVVGAVAWRATARGDAGSDAVAIPRPGGRSSAPPSLAPPSPSPSPAPHRATLVIHGTGDVSLDPSYIPAFGSRGYGWAWSGLGGLFRHDDLTVVNLECPATTVREPIDKEFVFRCDPAALPSARRSGVDVANQSNNHAFDQGPDGLLDSLRRIRRAGIVPVGAGIDQAQALRAAVVERSGWRIAVVGIDEVIDPEYQVAGPDTPGTAAGHDFPLALRAIREAAARADLVVVMIHWGVELDTQPRSSQVEEARRMIDTGADVIFGGHSHRLQPLRFYRGRPIFYSLGNFVWPSFSTEGSTTGVAEVTVRPTGRITARLIPATIVSDGHPVLQAG
ncbi:MAG: CapA family protein [Candidatus Velamenicoccus archaeovorus]